MDNKIFKFMIKMYPDITQRLDVIDKKLGSNTVELKSLGNQFTVLESNLKNDIKALYDSHNQIY